MGLRFNLQRVLGQLKYTGILDTVRVRASGYIIRKK
jgi:myosin heavy subunit